MATNIEQIFQEFVMNKIREIEDEGQNTGVTSEVHSNGAGPSHVSLPLKHLGEKHHPLHIAAGESMASMEGSETPCRRSKKHKRHKSKKKKKRRKVLDSSAESGMDSGWETRHQTSARNLSRGGNDAVHEPADPPMEEGYGKAKKQRRNSAKKKKKKKKKREGKPKSFSRSESTSASVSESELRPSTSAAKVSSEVQENMPVPASEIQENMPVPASEIQENMPVLASETPQTRATDQRPVVSLSKVENTVSPVNFSNKPKERTSAVFSSEKSEETALPIALNDEVITVKYEPFCALQQEAYSKTNTGETHLVSAVEVPLRLAEDVSVKQKDHQGSFGKTTDLPDIIPKLETARWEEPGEDWDRSLSKTKRTVPQPPPSQKSHSPSQSPRGTSSKPVSREARSLSKKSRSTSRRKKRSRSRSGRPSKRCQRSESRSRIRNRRSRSMVRTRRSHSPSPSRQITSWSRSRRSRSHRRNTRSRSRRRGRRSKSRSHSHRSRSVSRPRRSTVRRTRRSRSRSVVFLKRSQSRSHLRKNRQSIRRNHSRSKSVRRRRSKSQTSQHCGSRTPVKQRRSKTLTPCNSKRSNSRSLERRHLSKSKSPKTDKKWCESPKGSRCSKSPARNASKSTSISGDVLSSDMSLSLAQGKIVSEVESTTKDCQSMEAPPAETQEERSTPGRSKEREGPSEETQEERSTPGRSKEREGPLEETQEERSTPGRSKEREGPLEETQEERSTPGRSKEREGPSEETASQVVEAVKPSVKEERIGSVNCEREPASVKGSSDAAKMVSVGPWKPVPFLTISNAKVKMIPPEEIQRNVLSLERVAEQSYESKFSEMNQLENRFIPDLPLTEPGSSSVNGAKPATEPQNHGNFDMSEDGDEHITARSRSVSPWPSELLLQLPGSCLLKELDIAKKPEMDVNFPLERPSSPTEHEMTKLASSQSPSKEVRSFAEKMDSKSPLTRKCDKSKLRRSSLSTSPPRQNGSLLREKSKSRSPAHQNRSRSNSSSRKRRSQSIAATQKSKSVARRKRSRSLSPSRKKRSRSKSVTKKKSKPTTRTRRSRSKSAKWKRSKSRSPVRNKRSKSRSPRRSKRSTSRSLGRGRRSKSADKGKRSKSRSPARKRRSQSRSVTRIRLSRSRRSRSLSRRRRGAFRSRSFDRRDRWRREPSHSPVLILRKKRSTSRTRRSISKTPPRLTELDKDQLLEVAKANAAAMCAKAGVPIPESLRPKAILQLPLPSALNLPLSLSLGIPNICMSAAMATMTAATMTAALANMGALVSMPALPTITNKPPPMATSNAADIEEVKRKVTQKANSISIKELTEKCKQIAESKEEMAIAQPHVSDDEDDGRPFGGGALRENKGISFSLSNPSAKPAARSEAAFAKEFPVSSGSQHRKKEADGAYGEWVPVDKKEKAALAVVEDKAKDSDNVFPDAPQQPVDITLAVSERAVAQKRLAENPFDVNAICMLSRAQEQVDAWAQSNTIPGLFTGSTGAQVLSSDELSNSGPQAWIKKDQFLRATPVSGGVGEFLMRKMGWRTGEGLGKYREGTVEPIMIDFKTDRKGLVAEGEKTQKSGSLVVMKDLLGKHPVSALMEMCNKRKWSPPEFVMVHHSGPDHRKNFLFKVVVNGSDYQPQTASPNKKHAKAMAATVALQAMGEVSGDSFHAGPVFTAATTAD